MDIPIQDKSTRQEIILIHGNPGTGKTSSAWKHCQMKGWNPIVLDVNGTNFTPMPNLDIDFNKNHIMVLKQLKHWIPIIAKSDYDTIVIEDTGRLIDNKLTPVKGNEKNKFAKWEVRANAMSQLIDCLLKSKLNIGLGLRAKSLETVHMSGVLAVGIGVGLGLQPHCQRHSCCVAVDSTQSMNDGTGDEGILETEVVLPAGTEEDNISILA